MKTNDTNIQLDADTVAKIKAQAQEKIEKVPENELGEPSTAKEAEGAKPVEKVRNVTLQPKVEIEVYKDDKLVDTLTAYRNILEIGIIVKSLSEDKQVSIYALEDPEGSDPYDGDKRPRYPVFEIIRTPVQDALVTLAKQLVSPQACVLEFQRLCDFMSFRSPMRAANIVLLFKNNIKSGFSFLSSCVPINDEDYAGLYSATKEQNAQFKTKVKEAIPTVKFDDDSNIITHL